MKMLVWACASRLGVLGFVVALAVEFRRGLGAPDWQEFPCPSESEDRQDSATVDYKTPVSALAHQPSFRQRVREFASKYPETSEQRTRGCDRIEQALAERRAFSAAAAS